MCHVACAPRGRQLAALRRHVRARGCALRDLDLAPDAYDLRDADECRAFFARAYANGTAWPVTTNTNIDCHCMSKWMQDRLIHI